MISPVQRADALARIQARLRARAEGAAVQVRAETDASKSDAKPFKHATPRRRTWADPLVKKED